MARWSFPRIRRGALPRSLADLASPLYLLQLRLGLSWLAWPLLGTAAAAYRRTVLRHTAVVAIVGSYGKTTTTRAVAAALGLAEPPVSARNSWSAVALRVLRAHPGRPLCVEVGISRAGQMRRYGRTLRPDVVVLTAIGGEHYRSLGSLEAIAAEKAEMLRALRPGGVAVVNGDDERVRQIAAAHGGRVVTCGLGAGSEVRAMRVVPDWPRGSTLEVVLPGYQGEARLALFGEPGARAALAAIAVARELGVAPSIALARIVAVVPSTGRLQPVPLASGVALLRDDYKSGIETIEVGLAAFAAVPARRRVLVVGDVEEPRRSQHALTRELGRRGAAVASRVLYVGHHGADLRAGTRQAGLPRQAVTEHRDVHEVAATLRSELRSGDVVLIKGRHNQKLARVAMLLGGIEITCRLRSCPAVGTLCDFCPLAVEPERTAGGAETRDAAAGTSNRE